MTKLNWYSLSFSQDTLKYNIHGIRMDKFESSHGLISFTGDSFEEPIYFVESIFKYEKFDLYTDAIYGDKSDQPLL